LRGRAKKSVNAIQGKTLPDPSREANIHRINIRCREKRAVGFLGFLGFLGFWEFQEFQEFQEFGILTGFANKRNNYAATLFRYMAGDAMFVVFVDWC
jgi:hypothetical protein